ncbi:sporulation protein [Bacillus carboniphilus]|uniref:Sporulation protein n=1 Tax=Bacillus carboniphilus TaxID=86663 RepID=A0ABY9JXR4_9BACI|nr:sporulation membrane protein YtrI [Bacillus carboniphilus]WLR44172.1 sporulation protein [Bacillus carboniphilus]
MIGTIISWWFFVYSYGIYQEEYLNTISELQNDKEGLENKIKVLQDDYNVLNKKNQQQLSIQDITISIQNADQYKLREYSKQEIIADLKEDLSSLIAKDIKSVSKTQFLIKKTIENKIYNIDNKKYKLELKVLVIDTTLVVDVELLFSK